METKKELQKEIDKFENINILWREFYDNLKAIVARMPDDVPKVETKPEPSLLEVAMNLKCNYKTAATITECFESAEKLIAENERRKNGK